MAEISVCMIVKNEAAILARCLDSLKGIYDELIIVDTGSADNTKEIAAKYTDKIYDFEWSDNFSDARNYAFSLATKDYIYSADADEVIDEENREKFLAFKENIPEEAEIVQMKYVNQLCFNTSFNFDEEMHPMLYKRLRTFRFVSPIHESVRLEPVIVNSDIKITHMPSALHSKRDFSIYRRIVEKENLSEHLFMMYARELFISGDDDDFKNAADYFRNEVNNGVRSELNLKQGLCVVTKAEYCLGNYPAMFNSALKNMSDGKGSSEVCCVLGDYYFNQAKDYPEAALWYANAAFETSPELNIHSCGDYPFTMLSECCLKLGDEDGSNFFKTKCEEWKKEFSMAFSKE